MKKNKLGSSDLSVTEVCLGTMTWGEQNTREDAFSQMDYALDQGINFIDTAELYSVPPRPETYGVTENYIGEWLTANPTKRDELVIASKISGTGVPWARGGKDIDGEGIKLAVQGSLERLKTDYIDLYQLHWPNRPAPQFSKHWPGVINHQDVNKEKETESFIEILTALDDCIKEGKIRHIGLSNDTPWGLSEYLRLSREHNLPRVVSVQNEFSLLHMIDYPHLFETCIMENVAYLPWSPLAGGALTGKYRNGAKPEGCRWTMVQRNGIFRDTALSHEAIEAYYQVAKDNGLTVAQLSLAYVYQFAGVSSTIIGATSMAHLEENIGAYHLTLSEGLLEQIDEVIKKYPIPF